MCVLFTPSLVVAQERQTSDYQSLAMESDMMDMGGGDLVDDAFTAKLMDYTVFA